MHHGFGDRFGDDGGLAAPSIGSLWTAVFYHGVDSLVVRRTFDGSTIDAGATSWITIKFGIDLTTASIVRSIYA
jgi:hypothetical protein